MRRRKDKALPISLNTVACFFYIYRNPRVFPFYIGDTKQSGEDAIFQIHIFASRLGKIKTKEAARFLLLFQVSCFIPHQFCINSLNQSINQCRANPIVFGLHVPDGYKTLDNSLYVCKYLLKSHQSELLEKQFPHSLLVFFRLLMSLRSETPPVDSFRNPSII